MVLPHITTVLVTGMNEACQNSNLVFRCGSSVLLHKLHDHLPWVHSRLNCYQWFVAQGIDEDCESLTNHPHIHLTSVGALIICHTVVSIYDSGEVFFFLSDATM